MALNYDPKDAVQVWPAGDYNATLSKVEEKTSKSSGNEMEVWTWEVFNEDGRTQIISDYVVMPAATFKVKQLARALGREEEFEQSQFQAEDNIGADVVVELVIESSTGFDDKNKAKKYKAAQATPAAPSAPQTAPATQRQAAAPRTPQRAAQPQQSPRERIASRPRAENPINDVEQAFKESEIPF